MGKSKIVYGNCWVSYFDILGFKKLVNQYKGNIDSFTRVIYDGISGEIEKRSGRISEALNKVNYAWFSDSFILFTEDDTFASYLAIDNVSRGFFQKMMSGRYPLRGALSVGEFYADKERDTYIGLASIDAYSYAEKQKWIGLVLTPEAQKKLFEPGYTIDRVNYSEYQVPIKPEKIEKEKLFALNICRPNKKICYSKVIQMQKAAENEKEYEEKLKVIYENTLKFIEHLESQNQA